MKQTLKLTLALAIAIGSTALVSFSACKKPIDLKPIAKKAEAIITPTNTDVQVTGKLLFRQIENGVRLELEVVMPSRAGQSVAVHIHEHGSCGNSGGDAHGHWNPMDVNHGKWGEVLHHAGDIGNIPLDAEGRGTLTLETEIWTIGGDEMTNILNRSVIVHSGIDDYVSQPTGNSGPRVGCGVIQLKN